MRNGTWPAIEIVNKVNPKTKLLSVCLRKDVIMFSHTLCLLFINGMEVDISNICRENPAECRALVFESSVLVSILFTLGLTCANEQSLPRSSMSNY